MYYARLEKFQHIDRNKWREKELEPFSHFYKGPSSYVLKDEMLIDINEEDDPVITQSVIKHGKNIFQATVYSDGVIKFTKEVKLSPDELKEFMKLKDKMISENPHCCTDIPPDWSITHMKIHDINLSFPINGSCMTHTMTSCYKINKLLDEKLNENVFKDNKYKSIK